MCLPVNWSGSGEEYIVLSPNVEQGGLFDGHGRRAVRFQDDGDGHPNMCNAVLDITGDTRKEIVVWDPMKRLPQECPSSPSLLYPPEIFLIQFRR